MKPGLLSQSLLELIDEAVKSRDKTKCDHYLVFGY